MTFSVRGRTRVLAIRPLGGRLGAWGRRPPCNGRHRRGGLSSLPRRPSRHGHLAPGRDAIRLRGAHRGAALRARPHDQPAFRPVGGRGTAACHPARPAIGDRAPPGIARCAGGQGARLRHRRRLGDRACRVRGPTRRPARTKPPAGRRRAARLHARRDRNGRRNACDRRRAGQRRAGQGDRIRACHRSWRTCSRRSTTVRLARPRRSPRWTRPCRARWTGSPRRSRPSAWRLRMNGGEAVKAAPAGRATHPGGRRCISWSARRSSTACSTTSARSAARPRRCRWPRRFPRAVSPAASATASIRSCNERAFHSGIDFVASAGTKVHATAPGLVVSAGWHGGYGNMVEIEHAGGVSTRYGHLSAILVTEGQQVAAGRRDRAGRLNRSLNRPAPPLRDAPQRRSRQPRHLLRRGAGR